MQIVLRDAFFVSTIAEVSNGLKRTQHTILYFHNKVKSTIASSKWATLKYQQYEL